MVYLQNLLSVEFQYDEIALIIYVRMYQMHVGVILKDRYWLTHRQQTLQHFEESDIILAYFGKMNFKETVVHRITPENIVLPPHLRMPVYLTSRSRAPRVDVSDDIPVEEIDLSVNDANDVQVLSDIDKDKNTDGKSEDDDQPVDLSVAHAKESGEENLCPVDYSKPNANATDQCVSADDQTGQNVTPVGDQETNKTVDMECAQNEVVESDQTGQNVTPVGDQETDEIVDT